MRHMPEDAVLQVLASIPGSRRVRRFSGSIMIALMVKSASGRLVVTEVWVGLDVEPLVSGAVSIRFLGVRFRCRGA